jgi:sugar/nucleoside kinase (ribokinase family)
VSAHAYDYVTVGHVTVDVVAPGAMTLGPADAIAPTVSEISGAQRRPGGGAFYSALQAARLGLRALIVTQGRPEELTELLAPYRGELDLRVIPARQTTTLATSGIGAERRQRVLAWAGPIVDPVEVDTAILHLASVARETPTRWSGDAEFVGLTPQGLMRRWGDAGEISLSALDPGDLPEQWDAMVVSERERRYCEGLIPVRASTSTRAVTAVTAGSAPTTVVLGDETTTQVPAPAVERLRDDLGAGDVFAAAFFCALHSGSFPTEAAAYGNAAAAIRVSGSGPGAVGDRVRISGSLPR